MLGKVVVVAGAGAALLLRTRSGQQQYARLRVRLKSLAGGAGAGGTTVADRRPQAALEHRPAPPVLLPDATPVEVARAVLAEQPRS